MNLSQKGKSNQTAKWIFYRVKDFDRNRNNKIDEKDPNILYISDVYGENLKALTSNDENVVDFDIFEDQNFVLIKIQRDQNNDGDFESKDKDFYYIKFDLNTMLFGHKITIDIKKENE